MKSPALAEIMKPLQQLESSAKTDYENDLRDHEADELVAEEKRKVTLQQIRDALKKGDDAKKIAKNAVRDQCEKPTQRRYLINDTSVEKLAELLNENPNGLMLFRDELCGFLRSLDREDREYARNFYLECWNGYNRYTWDRIGRGTGDVEHACLTILGGIQPEKLRNYLQVDSADGMIQRFQLMVWPDVSSDWWDIDRVPNRRAVEDYASIIERLSNLDTSILGAIQGTGKIPYLQFDQDAQNYFREWRKPLEKRVRSGELPAIYEQHLSKYRSLVRTLALLGHLVDVGRGPVGLEHTENACAWADYLESHAQRIYAQAISPDHLSARQLARRLLAKQLPGKFALRDVYRPGWHQLADQETAAKAVNVLVEYDWLRAETVETGGRPRTWYHINPGINHIGA